MVDAPTHRPPKKAKVQSYAQRKRIEDLESRLFGNPDVDPTAGFGKELGSDGADGASAPPLLFFEDRQAGEGGGGGDGASPSGRDGAPTPAPAGGRRPRTRRAAAAAVTASDAAPAAAAPSPAAAPGSGAPAAAWHDPYVSAATVNVATGASRLRKLRTTEDEALLGGDAYEARLRSRFAATYENTGWAAAAAKAAADAAAKAAAAAAPAGAAPSGADLLASGASLLARPAGAGLSSAAAAAGASAAPLAPGRLEITRLPDANASAPSASVIQAVAFHPSGQLLLTAGFDKSVRFFQADGLAGAHLQTVHLRDCPVHSAAFARGGDAVIATGRRPFFYVLDLATGTAHRAGPLVGRPEKSFESFAASTAPGGGDVVALLGDRGAIPLFSLRSRTPVGELRHSGSVRAAAFDPADASGHTLLTAGGDGVVHEWDLRTRACVRTSVDEGSLGVTALSASPSGSLAVGSTSGVVNVYRRGAGGALGPTAVGTWAGAGSGGTATPAPSSLAPATPTPASRPTPARALMNLATSIDTLAWAASGAVLAIGSRLAADGLRLVHGGSLTVFPNWPTSRTPLGHVHAAAFSPGGGLLAAGTAKGRVLMYRLHDLPI